MSGLAAAAAAQVDQQRIRAGNQVHGGDRNLQRSLELRQLPITFSAKSYR
jgi:hypothetical protein